MLCLTLPLLFPADNVTVVLMDNNESSKCYGAVHITVNDATHPVCASTWTNENAEVVCRELNCGKVSFQCQVSEALIKKESNLKKMM